MKREKMCVCLLITALCMGVIPSESASAATAPVKLVKTSATLTITKKGNKTTYGKVTIRVKAKKGVKINKITYTSANKKVAKVSKKGKVTARKAGSTKIRVKGYIQKGKEDFKKEVDI